MTRTRPKSFVEEGGNMLSLAAARGCAHYTTKPFGIPTSKAVHVKLRTRLAQSHSSRQIIYSSLAKELQQEGVIDALLWLGE